MFYAAVSAKQDAQVSRKIAAYWPSILLHTVQMLITGRMRRIC